MKTTLGWATAALMAASIFTPRSTRAQEDPPYTETFPIGNCALGPRGVNDYFIPLLPGRFLLLSGQEEDDEGESVALTVLIQVLPGTKNVDGVRCAIVRETEWEDGELIEVSWNYFAICHKTKAVFYYGEHVNDYEDGEVVGHSGAWLAGTNGYRPGLVMPGMPLIGSRYYQEFAPEIALDRAEHTDNNATVTTPAGTFTGCLTVSETTPLEPDELSFKSYAPGVGLIHDDAIRLVASGRMPIYWDFNPYGDDGDEEEGDE
jgi:hypothetical protein